MEKKGIKMEKKRWLKNPTNGLVFPWSKQLAERADFIECDESGTKLPPDVRPVEDEKIEEPETEPTESE